MNRLRRRILLCFSVAFYFASNVHAQARYEVVQEKSWVKYSMHHPMHDWDAVSKACHGSIVLADDSTASNVTITIPVLSFDSNNGNRDSNMAEAVESYIYPKVSFKSKTLLPIAQSEEDKGKQEWRVEGDIDFHGIKRVISIPVYVAFAKEQLLAEGEFELKLTDFDIELPKLFMMAVKDWAKISFSIAAEISATEIRREQ